MTYSKREKEFLTELSDLRAQLQQAEAERDTEKEKRLAIERRYRQLNGHSKEMRRERDAAQEAVGRTNNQWRAMYGNLEAERDKLRPALELAKRKMPEAIAILRTRGYVFEHVPPVTDTGEHRWESLAFSFYTDLAEINQVAEAALLSEEEANGPV